MRHFSARETAWLQELDGIELAGFYRRSAAFVLDWMIIGILLSTALTLGSLAILKIARLTGHPLHSATLDFRSGNINLQQADAPTPTPPAEPQHSHIHFQSGLPPVPSEDAHLTTRQRIVHWCIEIFTDIIVPSLYFGLFLWRWNGRTPGKRLLKVRVVSLVHRRMTFWHSVERALGYGAAALEAGFGFFQFFFHPYRRCAQDRLAETIVVTERGYRKMLDSKIEGTRGS
jgi:uncharacterized RDD family membrane protein YckC